MAKVFLVVVIDEGPDGGVEVLAAHRTRTRAEVRSDEYNRDQPGYLRYALVSAVELQD